VPREEREEAIDAAARLLRHADRSRSELEQRLAAKGIEPEAVQEALDTLVRVGILDDARTAALRAERLAERGYGDAWIRAELERRSLPVEDTLAELEAENQRAARILERKGVNAAWLARRGFDPEVVAAVAGAGAGALGYGA
jgi:regulatory protein